MSSVYAGVVLGISASTNLLRKALFPVSWEQMSLVSSGLSVYAKTVSRRYSHWPLTFFFLQCRRVAWCGKNGFVWACLICIHILMFQQCLHTQPFYSEASSRCTAGLSLYVRNRIEQLRLSVSEPLACWRCGYSISESRRIFIQLGALGLAQG